MIKCILAENREEGGGRRCFEGERKGGDKKGEKGKADSLKKRGVGILSNWKLSIYEGTKRRYLD